MKQACKINALLYFENEQKLRNETHTFKDAKADENIFTFSIWKKYNESWGSV